MLNRKKYQPATILFFAISGSLLGLTLGKKSASDQPSVIVREHNSQMTTKRHQDVYPPEKKEISTETLNSSEFKQKYGIKKEKKNQVYGHPDRFFKLHQQIRTRGNEKVPSYPLNYRLTELNKARKQFHLKRVIPYAVQENLEWIERGPGNVSGRTRGIVVDPNDPNYNTWIVGSVAGGIWKTTDAGQSWTHQTPELPNLSISWIVMAPSNNDVLYAGTGEGFFNLDAVRGDGILKSIDHGDTWFQLPNTIEFASVNRLIVDPNDENVVVAVVTANFGEMGYYPFGSSAFGRIYKTINGGNKWHMVYEDASGNSIEHIVYNPDNFKTQYASINSVGVIKSTNGGESWTTILDITSLPNSGRLELAIAPSDTNVIYATLDNYQYGAQLYQSTNSGQNWINLEAEGVNVPNWLGSQGWYDNTIAVNPYNSDEVFLGGINLWKFFLASHGIINVQLKNTDLFLTFLPWGGFNDMGIGTGTDFSSTTGLPLPFMINENDYTSVEIRFGPNCSQLAHRFSYNGYEATFLDYTAVPFEIWDITADEQLMFSYIDGNASGNFELFPINWYNPVPEIIFINSVSYNSQTPDPNIAASTDGLFYKNIYTIWPILAPGATWNPQNLQDARVRIVYGALEEPVYSFTQLSSGYDFNTNTGVHVDHHNITIVPLDETAETFRIINGNDGGVFYSDDGGSIWENTLNGYNTTQFYGVDKRHGADEYIGGTQDNGTWQSPIGINAGADSDWLFRIGGDGYETAWHYNDPNQIIAGYQFNGLFKTTDYGENWIYIAGQIDHETDTAPFVTKVAKTNVDPDLIFAVGTSGIWRSENFGNSWSLISIPSNLWGFTDMTQIEISPTNPQIVWAGARMNDPNKPNATLHVSTNGGVSFTPTQMYAGGIMGYLTGLAVHPTDDSTAYALFSFADAPKILRTTDLGNTWEDISGFGLKTDSDNGFPDVATYCLLVMPHNPDIIWVGTEIGLFESTDNGQNWHYAANGFPAVSIWKMVITDDEVIVATHGRGIWSVTIPELPALPNVTLSPRLRELYMSMDGFLKINVKLPSAYDSTQVLIDDTPYLTLPMNGAPQDTTIDYAVTTMKYIDVQLIAYKNNKTYLSSRSEIMVFPLETPIAGYTNDFNTASSDFVGNGFQIITETGFSDHAIHTNHPYNDNTEISYLLKVPVIVKATNAFIQFDEIAIIEPGETGSVFGDTDFWDYVIVEGTADGINWQPLCDGYDARTDPAWLDAYNSGSVNESLYRNRTIDMLQTFSANDTILIRFRLFADELVNGWGWAIDNLEIQQLLSGVSESERQITPKTFNLSQNYPNPFNASTTILFSVPKKSNISLKVYDMMGREVETLFDREFSPGNYEVVWNAENLASGTYFYCLKAGHFSQNKKFILLK